MADQTERKSGEKDARKQRQRSREDVHKIVSGVKSKNANMNVIKECAVTPTSILDRFRKECRGTLPGRNRKRSKSRDRKSEECVKIEPVCEKQTRSGTLPKGIRFDTRVKQESEKTERPVSGKSKVEKVMVGFIGLKSKVKDDGASNSSNSSSTLKDGKLTFYVNCVFYCFSQCPLRCFVRKRGCLFCAPLRPERSNNGF